MVVVVALLASNLMGCGGSPMVPGCGSSGLFPGAGMDGFSGPMIGACHDRFGSCGART